MSFWAQAAAIAVDKGIDIWNNERNFYLQRKNLEWQKYAQNQIWQREDTAVQRRAADLKAAGFNPLLAAGGAASTGSAVQTTAPQSNLRGDIAEKMIAMARAQSDISMTRSQQKLLNEQSQVADRNKQLLDLQIQWYKDHPEYAPGISDARATRGLITDFLDSSNRLPQKANFNLDSLVSYHMKQGKSRSEALRMAKRQMKWQELDKKGYPGAYKVRNVLNYN